MDPTRRDFIRTTTAGIVAAGAAGRLAGAKEAPARIDARAYLTRLVYTRKEVDDWLAGRDFLFANHDGRLGWLLKDARFRDGIDGSTSSYHYADGGLHERRTIAYADRPCRVNTYGDSFTMCHQVSDGESWQEVLARHLIEPIRNFGVGAWSVYQAYLRMLIEEERVPADVIILNVYDDDHYRNLDAWRHIRCGKDERFLCPTVPHLKVNFTTGAAEEMPNPCLTPESVYKLCDLDWVTERFQDDFALAIQLALANAKHGYENDAREILEAAASRVGLPVPIDTSGSIEAAANRLHARAALLASMRIVEWVEAFARKRGEKVLYVLSFTEGRVTRYLETRERFDESFVEFLKEKGLPYVDLLEAHAADFAQFKIAPAEYVKRYYIGHYNPWGNVFTAFAVKDKLVEMLDPKPLAYQPPAVSELPPRPVAR